MHTVLTRRLGISTPILNAPMTPQAGGALARAVSVAGGLGMLGFDEDETEERIAAQLEIVCAAPAVPFGIGLVAWVLERRPRLLDVAIGARPALISISFGDVAPYVSRVRDAGILLAAQIQTGATARAALAAGVDVLVAQGSEAGGHTGSEVGTLTLLQLVLEMTGQPVLAAGGIATGRGMAAALVAGAAGVWVGTPFLLSLEARNTERARARICASDETQTIYTRVYDRLAQKPWPARFGARALRTPFLETWTGREDTLPANAASIAGFDPSEKLYAGQSVGMLTEVRPAAAIVADMTRSAREHLIRAGAFTDG